MIEEPVISLQLENEQLSLMMIMEHILSFQYKTYWKKYDSKNALKKEIFWQKSLTHSVNLCTTILMVGHPSAPVSPKHAISGVQSGWAATYLADSVPSVHYKGGEPYKMQIQVTKSKLTKFWPSRVLCAPSGMCTFLQFVQEYVLHL